MVLCDERLKLQLQPGTKRVVNCFWFNQAIKCALMHWISDLCFALLSNYNWPKSIRTVNDLKQRKVKDRTFQLQMILVQRKVIKPDHDRTVDISNISITSYALSTMVVYMYIHRKTSLWHLTLRCFMMTQGLLRYTHVRVHHCPVLEGVITELRKHVPNRRLSFQASWWEKNDNSKISQAILIVVHLLNIKPQGLLHVL